MIVASIVDRDSICHNLDCKFATCQLDLQDTAKTRCVLLSSYDCQLLVSFCS